jgi:hypothetical protein
MLLLCMSVSVQRFCCCVCCCCPFRDPTLPINRSEITRFPHAVLEVKLSLGQGQTSPAWVQVRTVRKHQGRTVLLALA